MEVKSEDRKNKGIMLLIDKPKDFTSARIVNIIKKKLNIKKAGHAGTLDPSASGLMIICTNDLTKSLNTFLDFDKEYEGCMILGKSTPSFDSETEVTKECCIDNISGAQIREKAQKFIGEILQTPPFYSAVKYKGQPLYKYARKNRMIKMSPRKVVIKEFEITNILLPEVCFRVVCSKGTYIRSLVNDFGNEIGVGAYLNELRRIRIGQYSIHDSIAFYDFISGNYHQTSIGNSLVYN